MTSWYWPQWPPRSSEAVRGCLHQKNILNILTKTNFGDIGYVLASNFIEATEAITEARLILAWKFK